MSTFGLYVHIPWCRSKCPYCDFNSWAATTWPERRYVEALVRELRCRGAETPWCDTTVSTVFFGGGTPSLFSADSVARVLDAAADTFGIEPTAEITLEANPGTVTVAKLRSFRQVGVNRISFGIQSFHPRLLKLLGRMHTVEETRLAAPMAREAGFESVNLDLIFALPGQTLEEWQSDLETTISFRPEHVSAYNLTYEEGTPFFDMKRDGTLEPAEEELEAVMFDEARERLQAAGYRAYEVSNFALPGRASRHNLNYWQAGAYLGIGAGAHSGHPSDAGVRHWSNERDPNRYAEVLLAGGSAEVSGEMLDPRRAAGEFAFLNLRLDDGFGEEAFRTRFGAPVESIFPGVLSLEDDGLLERRDGRLRLTGRGLRVADSVFASFV